MPTSPQPEPKKARLSIDQRLFDRIFRDMSVCEWRDGGWCSEPGSYREMADEYGCSPRTIQRAVGRLVRSGAMRAIPVDHGQGRTGTIYVTETLAPVAGTKDHRKALTLALRRIQKMTADVEKLNRDLYEARQALESLF